MNEPWCYAVAHGPGRTWIGLWGGAIVERDHGTGMWREYRDSDGELELDLYRDDGPPHEVTSFLCWDAGVLWQSTYFGLTRFDGRNWNSYVAKDTGIPADFIQHVTSKGHTAWLSTDQGMGVFDGSTCVTYRRCDDGRKLLAHPAQGVLHVTNAGDCTWHECATEIVRMCGRPVPVEAITTADMPRPAKRPAYSVLSADRLHHLGFTMPPWQDALQRFMNALPAVSSVVS